MAKKILTEKEIRDIVQVEIVSCFQRLEADIAYMKKSHDKMSKSVERIERLLIGDEELKDEGYAEMIKISYDHAKKYEEKLLLTRLEKVLAHFESWSGDGRWVALNEIIDKYKMIKWLTALLVSSGILSVANVISVIIHIFSGT